MKRYLLFAGYDYYPSGGMDDFKNDFDTIDEAIQYAKANKDDWQHIYDQQERKEVWNNYEDEI